ncbi:hypothetical protein WDW86_00355 [Bdellovibrionota bacterium FG-2]
MEKVNTNQIDAEPGGLACAWQSFLPEYTTAVYFSQNLMDSLDSKKQWRESRRCEAHVREALVGQGARTSAIFSSISHTRNRTVAIGAAYPDSPAEGQSHQLLGVGVDLEFSTRAVSHRVSDRISNNEERKLPLSPLEIWVIKEACWKSVPGNTGSVVWEVCIESYNAETRRGTFIGPRNMAHGKFQLHHINGQIFGFAAAFSPFISICVA